MPRPSQPAPARSGPGPAERHWLRETDTQLAAARAELRAQAEQLAALEAKLEERDARAPAEVVLEARLERAEAEAERLAERLEALERQGVAPAEGDVTSEGEEGGRTLPPDAPSGAETAAMLEEIERRLEALEGAAEMTRVRMRLEHVGRSIEDHGTRLGAYGTRLGSLEALTETHGEGLADTTRRLARLEGLFEELAEEVACEREANDLTAIQRRLDDLESLVLETAEAGKALEAKLAQPSVGDAAAGGPSGDDLTRLKGVGPKTARELARVGVTRFAQIAAWTREDIERIGNEIGVKPSRIERGGWVERASELAS